MVWKRPESVPFPSVWSRFKGRKPMADGKIPSFRIQDVTDELKDRVVDFMCDNFLHEEALSQNTSCKGNKDAESDFRKLWYKALEHRLAVVCLVEDEDGNVPEKPIIAGVNMTTLSSKGDIFDVEGTAYRSFMEPVIFVTRAGNPFERFGVNEYLTAYGLSVNINFRGQNIGYEILKARVPLCKAVGLKVTGTVFTATLSQMLAKRCGFMEYYDVTYADLIDKYNMAVTKRTESINFMALIISE